MLYILLFYLKTRRKAIAKKWIIPNVDRKKIRRSIKTTVIKWCSFPTSIVEGLTMRKNQEEKCIFWPLGFWAGDVCVCREGELAGNVVLVVSANPAHVPAGYVPVIYAHKNQKNHPPMNVPADSLAIYWPTVPRYGPMNTSRVSPTSWAIGLKAGSPIFYNGRIATVAKTRPKTVPLGYVPFYYGSGRRQGKKLHYVPADDIDLRAE